MGHSASHFRNDFAAGARRRVGSLSPRRAGLTSRPSLSRVPPLPARGMLALPSPLSSSRRSIPMCDRHRNPHAGSEPVATDTDETRREFMQTAGVAAGTAALGAATTSTAAEDKKPEDKK